MERTTRFKVLWTVWMAGGGVVSALVAYLVTNSVAWAILTLLLSGIVLNTVAQAVTRPVGAVASGPRRHRDRPPRP